MVSKPSNATGQYGGLLHSTGNTYLGGLQSLVGVNYDLLEWAWHGMAELTLYLISLSFTSDITVLMAWF